MIRGPLGERVHCPVLELYAGREPKPHVQRVPVRVKRNCSERDELLYRLLSKLIFTKKCWLWNGALRGGNQERHKGGKAKYGTLVVRGKHIYAHRMMFELLVMQLPAQFVIDHNDCHNANCVNPTCLEAVTLVENSRRAAALTNGYGATFLEDLF